MNYKLFLKVNIALLAYKRKETGMNSEKKSKEKETEIRITPAPQTDPDRFRQEIEHYGIRPVVRRKKNSTDQEVEFIRALII